MFEIRSIDTNHKADINIPNEPFPLCGKMIPSLCDGIWRYRIEPFSAENLSEMAFPDENYDFDEMSSNCYFVRSILLRSACQFSLFPFRVCRMHTKTQKRPACRASVYVIPSDAF